MQTVPRVFPEAPSPSHACSGNSAKLPPPAFLARQLGQNSSFSHLYHNVSKIISFSPQNCKHFLAAAGICIRPGVGVQLFYEPTGGSHARKTHCAPPCTAPNPRAGSAAPKPGRISNRFCARCPAAFCIHTGMQSAPFSTQEKRRPLLFAAIWTRCPY